MVVGSGTFTGSCSHPGTPIAISLGLQVPVAKAGRDAVVDMARAAEVTNKAFFNMGTPENLLKGMKNTEVWLLSNRLSFITEVFTT